MAQAKTPEQVPQESADSRIHETLLRHADPKVAKVTLQHLKHGLLRPLAAQLEQLLEDPVLKQVMDVQGKQPEH